CATIFVFIVGLGPAWGAFNSSNSIGCSSSCGSEGLAGGESVKGLMSSAEDNLVVPCAGTASGPGRNSGCGELPVLRTVQTLYCPCSVSPSAIVQKYCVTYSA